MIENKILDEVTSKVLGKIMKEPINLDLSNLKCPVLYFHPTGNETCYICNNTDCKYNKKEVK